MEAKDIVLAARKEYLEQSQYEQFKKAFEKVEAISCMAKGGRKETTKGGVIYGTNINV